MIKTGATVFLAFTSPVLFIVKYICNKLIEIYFFSCSHARNIWYNRGCLNLQVLFFWLFSCLPFSVYFFLYSSLWRIENLSCTSKPNRLVRLRSRVHGTYITKQNEKCKKVYQNFWKIFFLFNHLESDTRKFAPVLAKQVYSLEFWTIFTS